MKLRNTLWVAPLAVGFLAGCLRQEVVRVVDGVEQRGRFVPAYAYAEYARGAWAEARGDRREALGAYRAAVSSDPGSVELWTRIGALECEGQRAAEAFARAEAIDANYAPLWSARSQCVQDPAQAVALAERAFALDSGDATITLTLVRHLLAAAKFERAGVLLQEWFVTHPNDRNAWTLAGQWADGADDGSWRDRINAKLAALDARWLRPKPIAAAEHRRSLQDIGDGDSQAAVDRLTRRVAAEPEDTTARLVLALALDLVGEEAGLAALMVKLPGNARRPGVAARFAFAEVLARHLGPEAVQLWLGTRSSAAATDDQAMRQRWRVSLDEAPNASDR